MQLEILMYTPSAMTDSGSCTTENCAAHPGWSLSELNA